MGATVAVVLRGKFRRDGKLPVAPMDAPTENQTFNNKNSRSHELITRKKVSYSLRLTEI